LPAKCNPTVAPLSAKVVLSYEDGKTIDVVKQLQTKFKFTSREDPKECPMDKFFIYKAKGDYPSLPDSENKFGDVKITMSPVT